MKILFIHDTQPDFTGGAELSNQRIIDAGRALGHIINYHIPIEINQTKAEILQSDLVIVSSIFFCPFETELIAALVLSQTPYVRYEHDYGFCVSRDAMCLKDNRVNGCCHASKYRAYKQLFSHAILNVFLSPLHLESHRKLYRDIPASSYFLLPPPIDLSLIKNHDVKLNSVCFIGDLNLKKGGVALLEYAKQNPSKQIEVYGDNRLNAQEEISENISFNGKKSYPEILQILSETEACFFSPFWNEPSGRVAAEALLSGCKLIGNNNIGSLSFEFSSDLMEFRKKIADAPREFWNNVINAYQNNGNSYKKMNHVLVVKSHGGLGDIFISLPAVLKLKEISNKLTYAVGCGLAPLFKKYLTDIEVIDVHSLNEKKLAAYEKVIDLSNFPNYNESKFAAEKIEYPTHSRIRQHAISHYLDGVSLLHKNLDNNFEKFPYFPKKTSPEKYFTIHAGAGFLPKCYPIKNFEQLIGKILDDFETLNCIIITGKNDPDSWSFEKYLNRIKNVSANILNIAEILAGAQFHIGNDSGIGHLAGLFNIPSLTIHGPTGPGTWANFAEKKKVVWGKPNNCSIPCNFHTASSCEHRSCLTNVPYTRVYDELLFLLSETGSAMKENFSFFKHPKTNIEINDNYVYLQNDTGTFEIEVKSQVVASIVKQLHSHNPVKSATLNEEALFFVETLSENNILLKIPFD